MSGTILALNPIQTPAPSAQPSAVVKPQTKADQIADLRTALCSGAPHLQCQGLFMNLGGDLQLRCYELLFRDRIHDVGIQYISRDPAALLPFLGQLGIEARDLQKKLTPILYRAQALQEFGFLRPDLQLRCFELVCKTEIINEGTEEFARDRFSLLRNVEVEGQERSIVDHLLYDARGGTSVDEMVSVLTPFPFPHGVATLVARYAMQCFDSAIFGPKRWESLYGAIPVTLPPIENLRERALLLIRSTGNKPPKNIEEMTADECANFVREQGKVENLQPPEDLYVSLNSRLRPSEKLAGLTCVVTYIPQFVRKGGQVLGVSPRTLTFQLPPLQGRVATLANEFVLNNINAIFNETEADGTQPSCYFMMERGPVTNTKGKPPVDLAKQINQLGKDWQLPEPRNFIATVFSRCAWTGQLLCNQEFIYAGGLSEGYFRILSNDGGRLIIGRDRQKRRNDVGAAASRKFLPACPSSQELGV